MSIADLTPEEREQVYLEVELSHLVEDAEQQVANLIELGFSKREYRERDIDYLRWVKYHSLEQEDFVALAKIFQDEHDCNYADNDQWATLIEDYVDFNRSDNDMPEYEARFAENINAILERLG